jgi:hypothetical protein
VERAERQYGCLCVFWTGEMICSTHSLQGVILQ